MNLITETIDYFVSTLNMIWNSLAYIVVPGTGVNGQFLFVFTLIFGFSIAFIKKKFAPPMKVDTELPDDLSLEKKKQTYQNISKKDLWW